jgi:hypothetical protein
MTGQQHAVMWMGLLLIVLRMFTTTQWESLKAVLGAGAASPTGSSGNSTPGSSSLPDSILKGLVGGPLATINTSGLGQDFDQLGKDVESTPVVGSLLSPVVGFLGGHG